jgi:hypothetical protein
MRTFLLGLLLSTLVAPSSYAQMRETIIEMAGSDAIDTRRDSTRAGQGLVL